MRFRKKLKKYPTKGDIVNCNYPILSRVRVLSCSRHKHIGHKNFLVKVLSVQDSEYSHYIGQEYNCYISELPQFLKKFYR